MALQFRHSRHIAPSVRFIARKSSDLSTSFGRRGLSFTADTGARTAMDVPAAGLSHQAPIQRTPIRRGHGPAGGLLFSLFVIGLLLVAVALSAS
jgi:Protein of unknown function (DUF4236)